MPRERDEHDVDAAFAEIVSHWSEPDLPEVGRWPAQEDADPAGPTDRGDATGGGAAGGGAADHGDSDPAHGTVRGRHIAEDAGPDAVDDALLSARAPVGPAPLGPRDHVTPGDDELDAADSEGGFVPPEPPPLPRGDLVSRLAWAGVLLGPAYLVLAALVLRDGDRSLVALAVAAFVAGFVTLVARMPVGRDEDDPDDGAVV